MGQAGRKDVQAREASEASTAANDDGNGGLDVESIAAWRSASA